VERLIVSVLHLAHIRGQDVGEHKVRRIQNLLPGTEIFRQQDFSLLALPGILRKGKAVIPRTAGLPGFSPIRSGW
jgi:hypothetical protein